MGIQAGRSMQVRWRGRALCVSLDLFPDGKPSFPPASHADICSNGQGDVSVVLEGY
jgi:hypothetical protein